MAGRANDEPGNGPVAEVSGAVRLFHASLILATPWVQLALNPDLFMTPGGNRYIDPWLYTGFFLSMPDLLARFPDTYYGSRVSWLLPGYVAHKAFSPLVANYVLHLAFFYALLIATYLLLSATTSRRAAMLVTIVLAWNPIILAAVSWDYVDGAGIVFIMGTLMSLEKATQGSRARWAWSLLAGALMASMASSNVFLVVMWPLFGLFLLLRAGIDRFRDVVAIAATAMAGAVMAFVALAALNVSLGGTWLFLMPQLRMSRTLASAPNPWRVPGYQWLWHAPWLALPAIATVGAVVACFRPSRVEAGFARAMQVMMLAAVAVWAAVQVSGTPVFQISFYSSYLAPFALIALPLQFDVPSSRLRPHVVLLLECAAVALFAAAHWLMFSDPEWFWSRVYLAPALPLAGVSALVLIVVSVRWATVEWMRWALFALCFSILAGAASGDLPVKSHRLTKAYYEEVVAAHRFIERHLDARKLRVWTSDPRGNRRPIIGLAATYLWGFSLLNYELPRLNRQEAALLTHETRLVVLVPTVEDAEAVRAPLQEYGFDFDVIASASFGTGDIALAVVIGDLR